MSKRFAALQVLRLKMREPCGLRTTSRGDLTFEVPREAATVLNFLDMWRARHASRRNGCGNANQLLIRQTNQCLGGKFCTASRITSDFDSRSRGSDCPPSIHMVLFGTAADAGTVHSLGRRCGARSRFDGFSAALVALALVWIEQALAQPDRFRGDFDQLVVLDVGQRLLQGHADRRGKPHRLVL